MGYEIVTVSFCAQYFSTFEVLSSRDGRMYRVTLYGTAAATCTCSGYKYSRTQECKHIVRVWAEACLWNPQWKDPGPGTLKPISYHGQLLSLGQECPGCSGPVVPVRIAV